MNPEPWRLEAGSAKHRGQFRWLIVILFGIFVAAWVLMLRAMITRGVIGG